MRTRSPGPLRSGIDLGRVISNAALIDGTGNPLRSGVKTPRDVELLVECGLTPMEAIVAATRNGAEVIGVTDRLGTIEPGKLADLIILSANPLEDIRHLRRVELVIQGGKIFDREQLAYHDQPTSTR